MADIGQPDGANHVLLGFVVPSDEEISIDLAHAGLEEVGEADGLIYGAKQRSVETYGEEESKWNQYTDAAEANEVLQKTA